MMKTLIILGLGVLLLSLLAEAQSTTRINTQNLNGWYNYFGDHPVSDRSGNTSGRAMCRHNFITRWQQLLLRPGVNLKLRKPSSTPTSMATSRYGIVFPSIASISNWCFGTRWARWDCSIATALRSPAFKWGWSRWYRSGRLFCRVKFSSPTLENLSLTFYRAAS